MHASLCVLHGVGCGGADCVDHAVKTDVLYIGIGATTCSASSQHRATRPAGSGPPARESRGQEINLALGRSRIASHHHHRCHAILVRIASRSHAHCPLTQLRFTLHASSTCMAARTSSATPHPNTVRHRTPACSTAPPHPVGIASDLIKLGRRDDGVRLRQHTAAKPDESRDEGGAPRVAAARSRLARGTIQARERRRLPGSRGAPS